MVEFYDTINSIGDEIIDKWMSAYIEQRAYNYITLLGISGIPIVDKPDGKFDNAISGTDMADLERQINMMRKTIEEISSPREVSFGEFKLVGGKIPIQDIKYRYSYDLWKNGREIIESNINDLIAIQCKIVDNYLLQRVASNAGITEANVTFPTATFATNPISVILRVAFAFRNLNMGIDPNYCILTPARYLQFLDFMNSPSMVNTQMAPIKRDYQVVGWNLGPISVIGSFNPMPKDSIFLDTSRRGIQLVTKTDTRFSSMPGKGAISPSGNTVGGNLFYSFSGASDEVPNRMYTTVGSACDVQILNKNVIGAVDFPATRAADDAEVPDNTDALPAMQKAIKQVTEEIVEEKEDNSKTTKSTKK